MRTIDALRLAPLLALVSCNTFDPDSGSPEPVVSPPDDSTLPPAGPPSDTADPQDAAPEPEPEPEPEPLADTFAVADTAEAPPVDPSEEDEEDIDEPPPPPPDVPAPPPPPSGGPCAGSPELLPDLFVWADASKGYLYGGLIDAGTLPGRRLYRFTTTIANAGAGPADLRGAAIQEDGSQAVMQRVWHEDGCYEEVLSGLYEFHPFHEHIHFDAFADYRIRRVLPGGAVGEIVAASDKVSFCLRDDDVYDSGLAGFPSGAGFAGCAQLQGISVGWADVYEYTLPDQWIDVTAVPAGTWWLEVEVDPEQRLHEDNEGNNVTRILISLP